MVAAAAPMSDCLRTGGAFVQRITESDPRNVAARAFADAQAVAQPNGAFDEKHLDISPVYGGFLRPGSCHARLRPGNGHGRAEGDCASDNRGVWSFVGDRLQRFRRMLALCQAIRLPSGRAD